MKEKIELDILVSQMQALNTYNDKTTHIIKFMIEKKLQFQQLKLTIFGKRFSFLKLHFSFKFLFHGECEHLEIQLLEFFYNVNLRNFF